MTAWLDPVRGALDDVVDRGAGAPFFFRDDDGGWGDAALDALLDRFAAHALTVDVAAIPAAVDRRGAARLARRVDDGVVLVHQHGWAHTNHEPVGRSCEFGASRAADEQRRDIAAGRARLTDLFGPRLQPIFTPPWNRCTETTAEALVELGFSVLSRQSGAAPFNVAGLAEVPITFDWFAKRKGVALTRAERGERLAAQVAAGGPVGVMLHHAVTDDDELAEIDALLALISGSPAATTTTIAEVAARDLTAVTRDASVRR